MTTKNEPKQHKLLKLVMCLAFTAALIVSLGGCKLSEKESREKVRKQNESFEWKVDAKSQAAFDSIKPQSSK